MRKHHYRLFLLHLKATLYAPFTLFETPDMKEDIDRYKRKADESLSLLESVALWSSVHFLMFPLIIGGEKHDDS